MTEKLSADKMASRFKLTSKPFMRETLTQLEARIAQLEGKYPQPDVRSARHIAGVMIMEMAMWLDGVLEPQLERADGDYDAFEKQMKQMITRKLEVLLGQRYGPAIERDGITLVPRASDSPPRPAAAAEPAKVEPRRKARQPRAAIGKRMKA
jgi:hypothetical protein